MTKSWAQSQREGWLSELYGESAGEGSKKLSTDSVQSRLVDVFEGLFSHVLSPEDAATRTASLILSQEEIGTPWDNFLGLYLSAAESLEGEEDLTALAQFIRELASLPDAMNRDSGKKLLGAGGHTTGIDPGEAIAFEEGILWKDLPRFSQNLTESLQGPERYLHRIRSPATPDDAKKAWKNLNTCIALISQDSATQRIPALAALPGIGLRTLAMALEYSPGTFLGQNAKLHAPAAAQWLRIASKAIESICTSGNERVDAGDLWAGQGGGKACDNARLAFWRNRLMEFGY